MAIIRFSYLSRQKRDPHLDPKAKARRIGQQPCEKGTSVCPYLLCVSSLLLQIRSLGPRSQRRGAREEKMEKIIGLSYPYL